MKLRRLLLCPLLISAALFAQSPRNVQNFDFDWRFQLSDDAAASSPGFDDSAWRKLDVPHDWSIEGDYAEENPGVAVSAFLPTGIGWYRKEFVATPEMMAKEVEILFDGVFMDSTVWINGQKLGTEPYGYMSFHYTLSTYLHPGKNVIAVRVNNLLQPAARWYTGSGIYGHVWLTTLPKEHIARWSTFIRTRAVENGTATLDISTALESPTRTNRQLRFTIRNDKQAVVAQRTVDVAPPLANPLSLTISNPSLWSTDSPTLYTLQTELMDGKKTIDAEETTFGIRTMHFDAERGFFLNGQPLKIKGMGDHLYGGPMGTAIPDQILERRLRLLKGMGLNALRTAHNPHTPFFYDLCDRLGILVMDEIYDGWHKKVKNEYADRFYESQWHHDVERWVRRDRNHASIFAWSLGNETGLADVNHMGDFVHTFDPTRPTTGGMMTKGVDISGWNGPGEVPGVLDKFHAENPTVPIILTEEPHTLQTRGYYRVRTWWRDWKPVVDFPEYGKQEIFFDGNQWYNSSYDNAIVRGSARYTWLRDASKPWIAGEFRWLGFDYIGEAAYKGGHWPVRAENFGIIDLAAIPKDHYYLYQAFWTTKPMVHLLPHWTHPGMDGITIPVVAYSNQAEVELFLNGKTLGRRKQEPLGDFVWKVPYQPGKLEAIAFNSNGDRTAATGFQTAGDPTTILAETDNNSLRANRTDDAVITFTVVDRNGVMVPWNMNRLHFKINGPVHLLGNENGDPADATPNQSPWRNAFYGMARGFYQATGQNGPIDITAAAILGNTHILNTSETHPRLVAIAVSRTSLRGPLSSARIEVHYTVDGTKPTSSSPLYTAPFGLSDDTTVRALVLKDGAEEIFLTQSFHRTDDTLVTDPRWATDSQRDPLEMGGRREYEGAEADRRRLQQEQQEPKK